MIGHWSKAKIDTAGPQAVGHSLALNGYVCLSIDPWGAGEREQQLMVCLSTPWIKSWCLNP